MDDEEEPLIPVVVDTEEVQIVLQKVHRIIGTPFDKKEFESMYKDGSPFSFCELLQLLESHLVSVNVQIATNVVDELYEEYILGVLKKVRRLDR